MELGEAIRLLRKEKRWSQTELAERSKCSMNTIRTIEIGKQFPYKYTIDNICAALNVSIVELLLVAISDEPESPNVKLKARELSEAIRRQANKKYNPQ